MSFESGEPDGHDFVFKFVGIVVVMMMLGTILEGMGYFNFTRFFSDNQNEETGNPNRSFLGVILDSNLDLGDNVVNTQHSPVFQNPGQNPIGRQVKGASGRIMEGPIVDFGARWWRVNYEEAPNGWVDADYLTNKKGLFTTLNIIPITLNFLAPVAVIILILMLAFLVVIILKNIELNKTIRKKLNLIEEQKIIEKGHDPEEKEHHVISSTKSDENIREPLNYETENYEGHDFDESEGDVEFPVENLPVGPKPKTEAPSNRRWSNIQTLINSYNQNDWKQAIIEADTILEEMLEKIGYTGNSIGDRLKMVNPADFLTINHAWEAHKVRNRIAHGGSNFTLSKNESERIINLYKEVFNEFFYL